MKDLPSWKAIEKRLITHRQQNSYKTIKISEYNRDLLKQSGISFSGSLGDDNYVALSEKLDKVDVTVEFINKADGNIIFLGHDQPIDYRCILRVRINGHYNTLFIRRSWINFNIDLVGNNNEFYVGYGSSCGSASCWVQGNTILEIGDDCMLAWNIFIRTGDVHAVFSTDTKSILNHPANVIIGDHVWVAHDVLVQKGSFVGNGSIVGSGSIVAGRHGSRELIVGSPSKSIKKNVTWTRESSPSEEKMIKAMSYSDKS